MKNHPLWGAGGEREESLRKVPFLFSGGMRIAENK